MYIHTRLLIDRAPNYQSAPRKLRRSQVRVYSVTFISCGLCHTAVSCLKVQLETPDQSPSILTDDEREINTGGPGFALPK